MQVHNPGASPVTLRIGFRTTQQIAGQPMPSRIYTVAPRATMAIEDVLTDLGTSGIGSLDVTSESFSETRPIFLVRVFNDGLDGQTGMTEPVLAHHEVPQVGDRIILLAPTTPGTLRFNVGLRTLAKGATIDYTVRNSLGQTISQGYREFPTEYFVQQPAADFFGFPLGANDSVEFRVLLGAVAIYGATTDNITQDPSLQLGRR
jgi:hypothetical protein